MQEAAQASPHKAGTPPAVQSAASTSRRGLQLPKNACHIEQAAGCAQPAASVHAPQHADGPVTGQALPTPQAVPHATQATGNCSRPTSRTSEAGSRSHTRLSSSEEMSFEELRAAGWLAKHAALSPPEPEHLTPTHESPESIPGKAHQVFTSKLGTQPAVASVASKQQPASAAEEVSEGAASETQSSVEEAIGGANLMPVTNSHAAASPREQANGDAAGVRAATTARRGLQAISASAVDDEPGAKEQRAETSQNGTLQQRHLGIRAGSAGRLSQQQPSAAGDKENQPFTGSIQASPTHAAQLEAPASALAVLDAPGPPAAAPFSGDSQENAAPSPAPSPAVHPQRLFETPARSRTPHLPDPPASGARDAGNPCLSQNAETRGGQNFGSIKATRGALQEAASPGTFTDDVCNAGALPDAAASPGWSREQDSMGLGRLSLPTLEPAGEDLTMATKEAFAAVNSMFGTVMPCYGSGVYRVSELPAPALLATCTKIPDGMAND